MRIPRLLSIVGPAAVLYLLAARAFLGVSAAEGNAVVVFSVVLSLAPLLLLSAPARPGTARLAWMGVFVAVALATSGAASSSTLRWTHDLGWLGATMVMLDLALPGSLRRSVRALVLTSCAALALLAALLGGSGLLPSSAFGVLLVVEIVAVGTLHLLLLVRRGHVVEGALSGIAIVCLAVGLAYAWFGVVSELLATWLEFGVAALLWLGHLAWLDPYRATLRRAGVPFLAACGAAFGIGVVLSSRVPKDAWQLGLAAAAIGVVWSGTYAATKRLGRRAAWSTAGELVDRANAARRNLFGRVRLEDVAAATLAPLTEALESDDPHPELFTLEPPLALRLDSRGIAGIRSAEVPTTLVRGVFRETECTLCDVLELKERVVREPAIRGLVEAMDRQRLGAVVPCAHLGDLEALLTLPIAGRSDPLSPVEVEALLRLGRALGSALSPALAQRRAETHIHELSSLRRRAEDRAATLEGELEQLRGQFEVLGRGLSEDQTLHVAYSAAMRALQTRAIELARTDTPILWIASPGAPTLPISRFVHDRGPRWKGPFVVADCGSAPPDGVIERLFGTEAGPRGWLESAREGTLLLRDLPALPHPAQARLADVLSGPPTDGSVRVIATVRRPLAELRHASALDPELARRFTGHEVVVPSLRDRREDVPSLVLLAIDRACRVLGREPVGIEQDAMTALVSHDWPGDVAELELAVELAVARAAGQSIRLADLPAQPSPGQDGAWLDGTYLDVERQLLQRTLRRAAGNKSEAARMLGLKRTTFLDKLRRHGLEKQESESMGGSALG